MTTTKPTAKNTSKLVSYKISAVCTAVSPERLAHRKGDSAMVEEQLQYDEDERVIIGSENTDPTFSEQLGNLSPGQSHSFVVKYPEWDKNNMIALPISYFKANRIVAGELAPGMTIGVDLLKGRVQIDGTATDLEVVEIRKVGKEETAILDSNDPQNGLSIQFDIEVLEVRDPTSAELLADSEGRKLPRD